MRIGKSFEISPKGIMLVVFLVMAIPGTAVYTDSLLSLLERVLEILSKYAKIIPAFFSF